MSINVELAIASLERRDNLRAAEANGAWVIRRARTKREKSKNEREDAKRLRDSATCFHGFSYTMPCKQCRRSKEEGEKMRLRIKAKLSIT